MDQSKYIHDETIHNLKDPEIIVPVIMEVLKPQSVVDLGCGTGTFLHVFEKQGVKKIVGLDGEWVNKEQLAKYISLDKFQVVDLEKGFEVDEKFDLAVCLEVLEHLGEEFAHNIIKNLTQLSDIILFSAAIPGQPGQNHINGKWPDYWDKKFQHFDFTFHDVLRPIFWNNNDLQWWYRQNIFLVLKNGKEEILDGFSLLNNNAKIKSLVHPDCYLMESKKVEELTYSYTNLLSHYNSIIKGEASFKTYLKFFTNYLLRKVSL